MRRFRAIAAMLALWSAIAGCGGDGDRTSTIVKFTVSELRGLVISGFDGQKLPPEGDLVRAQRGELDFRDGRVNGQGEYVLSVTNFAAPYLVVADGTSLRAMAVTAGTTTVNVSPLSDLLLIRAAFDANVTLDATGIRAISEDRLNMAMRRLQDHLLLIYGVSVPADWRTVMTTPAAAVPGDPLYDANEALQQAWTALGLSYSPGARLLYEAELRRCAEEQVLLTLGARETAFCPQDRASEVLADGAVMDRFYGPAGEQMTLNSRDGAITRVRFDDLNGQVWQCEAQGCQGATLGPTAADGSRRLNLAAVALHREGLAPGRAEGGVTALPAGTPRLPCAKDFLAVVREGLPTQADCLLGSSLRASGEEVQGLASATGLSSLNVEVRHRQGQVREVLLWGLADQPAEVVGYRCQGLACAGTTVTQNDPEGTRHLQLSSVVLSGVDGAGRAIQGSTVHLLLSARAAPPGPPWQLPDCRGVALTVAGKVSDGGEFTLCPNPVDELRDQQGFTLDPDAGAYVYLWQHFSQGAPLNAVLNVTEDRIDSLSVQLDEAANFYCNGETCAELAEIGPPDPLGRRRVDFHAASLPEFNTLGLPTGRSISLAGWLNTVSSRCLDQENCR